MAFPHIWVKPANGCLWHWIMWLVNTADLVEEVPCCGVAIALLAKENWQGGPY